MKERKKKKNRNKTGKRERGMRDVEKRGKEIGMVNEGSSLQFTSGDRGVGPNF